MMKKKVRTIIGLTALICTIGMNLETNWLYADEGDFITEDSADEQNFIVKSSADTGYSYPSSNNGTTSGHWQL